MTQELRDIFAGKRVPTVRAVDYTGSRKQELKNVIARQREILKLRDVDWQHLNTFVMKI